MSTDAFNIAVKTLTTIAGDVLAATSLHPLLQKEGAKLEDWKKLQKSGQDAEAADAEQQAATRKLSTVQEALDQSLAIIDKGIRDIKIRTKAVVLDLKQDATATEEDKAFMKGLSFAVPAPRRKATLRQAQGATPKETNTDETAEQRKRESASQEALKLQITRMVDGIAAHSAVAKAFAARELSAATLAGLKQSANDLPTQQQVRDAAYDVWLAVGAKERQAVTIQSETWDSIRKGVARVAKTNTTVKQLLDRLAAARLQTKTGTPRKREAKKS